MSCTSPEGSSLPCLPALTAWCWAQGWNCLSVVPRGGLCCLYPETSEGAFGRASRLETASLINHFRVWGKYLESWGGGGAGEKGEVKFCLGEVLGLGHPCLQTAEIKRPADVLFRQTKHLLE